MRTIFLCMAMLLLVILCASVAIAIPWPPPSPLTLLGYDDPGLNHTAMLSLPWYGIQDWEVQICTQGLTSSVGASSGTNDVTTMSLSTPIYMDTVTLLAKKSPYNNGYTDGYYYEVGWYVQPFQEIGRAHV
jgi:hypothetical protein